MTSHLLNVPLIIAGGSSSHGFTALTVVRSRVIFSNWKLFFLDVCSTLQAGDVMEK